MLGRAPPAPPRLHLDFPAQRAAQSEEPPGELRESETLELRESETLLYGLEALYARHRTYVSMLATSASLSKSNPSMAAVNLGAQPTLARMGAELEADCIKAGFAGGTAGFEKVLQDYVIAFERETVALADVRLIQYQLFLESQEERYQQPAEADALFQAVATSGARDAYEEAEGIRSQHMSALALTSGDIAEQSHWHEQWREALARAESKMGLLTGAHPVVGEVDFNRERLARASKQEVRSEVLNHLAARKKDIADTRRAPRVDAGAGLRAGRASHGVIPRAEHRARHPVPSNSSRSTSGTWSWRRRPERWRSPPSPSARASTAAAAGRRPCSPSGRPAPWAPTRPSTRCSATRLQSSAYGAKLTSEEPTMAWAIVAVLGAGVDAAAFASVLPKLRPALAAFNAGPEAGNLLALDRKLARLAEVEASIRQTILRAASAEVEARAAWKAALLPRAPLQAVITPGAAEFGRLVHAVYLSGKHGLRKFQLFLKTNEAVELLGDVTKLRPEELAVLKRGYLAAVKQVEAVAAHGKALGMSDGELDAFMASRRRARKDERRRFDEGDGRLEGDGRRQAPGRGWRARWRFQGQRRNRRCAGGAGSGSRAWRVGSRSRRRW